MADRFPLIVNSISKKIEELVSGDNLELTGNGIVIGGDTGSGKYLTSDGISVFWGEPGNVYLTQTQTLTNKTLENCAISGSVNTLTNIPNSALVNKGITVNGVTIPLGGSVVTPDNDTTYTLTAKDGFISDEKLFSLTNSSGVSTNITFGVELYPSAPAGTNPLNLNLTRVGNTVTLTGYVTDNNTQTFLIASGGSAQSGTITFTGSGDAVVSMDDATKTIDIRVDDQDTITELRANSGSNYKTGKVTFLPGNFVTLSQQPNVVDPNVTEITVNSVDTVTKLRGGTTGTFIPTTSAGANITITGGSSGNVTVSQVGTTINIDSVDTNSVTRLATETGTLAFGDFRLKGSGATTIQASSLSGVTTFTVESANDDTGALLTASNGVVLSTYDFQLKNAGNLTDTALLKWDGVNTQLSSGIITDNGSTVTINGNLVVNGTNTIVNTTQLNIADPTIELRRGNSLQDGSGGVQVNRTTDSSGVVVTYSSLQFFHSGGYWRVWDGSISRRLVTENETQVLTNKTLTSPTLTTPILGSATATSINGLAIATSVGAALTPTNNKNLKFENNITLTADDSAGNVTVDFDLGGGAGARVMYSSDNLGSFAATTSAQVQSIMTDATGVGGKMVFSSSPTITTAINSSSASFNLINSGPTLVNFAGAATTLNIGNTLGTTTIRGDSILQDNVTLGTIPGDAITINGAVNFANVDITIRGASSNPMTVGRGGNAIPSNTAVGYAALVQNASGGLNTAIGYQALQDNGGGNGNTALGYRAGADNQEGDYNISIGYNSAELGTGGDNNVAVGSQSLHNNLAGSDNVCIGHFAGFACTGSGNVLIGPASTQDDTSVTYQPISPGGNQQLVIGSGDLAWIRGSSAGNITLPHALRVEGTTTLVGDLVVQGSTVTVDSRTLTVDDKNIELAAVVLVGFSGSLNNTNVISNVPSTTGLLVGMEVTSTTGGVVVPANTYITNITGPTVTVSNTISGSGLAQFAADGPTDLSAEGGGVILKGTVDKTILYDGTGATKFWVLSENLKLPTSGVINYGTSLLINPTTIGSTVVNSSLTSVGTLTSLEVGGNISIGGRTQESTLNQFTTPLTPSSNVLTISLAGTNTVLGTPANTPITTWDFTNVGLDINQSITVTLILAANTAATYGDACNVDGVSIGNGVQWSGGSPPLPTSNTDILTFIFVKDAGGNIKVFGQGNTNFS